MQQYYGEYIGKQLRIESGSANIVSVVVWEFK